MNRHFFLLIPLFSLSLASCQLTSTARNSPQLLSAGAKPFHFEPQEVKELTLAKTDPSSGDQWLAVLQHRLTKWEIVSHLQNEKIQDEIAEETFVFHLIDAFRSIQIVSTAPRGTLESFQLDPPRFGVRWKTKNQEFEFKVGSRLKDNSGVYFTLDGTHVYIARGGSLSMLDMIESFQFLRKKTWTLIHPDDIDEIELRRQGKFILYAQREGDRWTDRQHKRIKQDMETLLNGAVQAQSRDIVDDPIKSEQLKKLLQKDALYEAHLSDRFGKVTLLKVKTIDSVLYGINSSRPQAVFVLNPELLQLFHKVN